MREARARPTVEGEVRPSGATLAQWTFASVAAALLAVMVLASFDFGASWDEKVRHRFGEQVWEYYAGDRSLEAFEDRGRVYGGLFDIICVAVERWVQADRYVIRHVINAIFGWAGVVFSGALAARLFGTWTGVLALVLLASSPRYFADSMNNPKDLPFAATSVAALYFLSRISPTYPYLSKSTAVGVVISLAIALNIRPAALLYVGYLGLLVGAFVLAERSFDWRRWGATATRLAIIVVAVLLLGTLFWPWAQQAPLTRPFEAMFEASEHVSGGRVLFNGQNYRAANVPWTYAPWWLLISSPPVVIAGLVLAVAWPSRSNWALRRAPLWVAGLLPLVLVIIKNSTLYDGIRHLLFIYPVLVVLAASGWVALLTVPRTAWLRYGGAALLAAGLINVLAFHVRSHPNQTAYFNELVGGPRGAFGKYDQDYWGNCLLEAVAWTAERARGLKPPIYVSGSPPHLVEANAARFPEVLWGRRKHTFEVRMNRGTADGVLARATRSDALYRVQTADGAVLCSVFPGPRYADVKSQLSDLSRRSSHDQPRAQ
jgi:hypothetical protein